jgi:hypothetical protein
MTSTISTEPGPISPALASQPTLRLNQCLLAFAFGIGLIVPLFLFGAGIGSAQTVPLAKELQDPGTRTLSPTTIVVHSTGGTCAAFLEELEKGPYQTPWENCNGQDEKPPVNGRCPPLAGGQTLYALPNKEWKGTNTLDLHPRRVTSGYYCSVDGQYTDARAGCAATCSGKCKKIKPTRVCVKGTMPPTRELVRCVGRFAGVRLGYAGRPSPGACWRLPAVLSQALV